MFRCSFSAGVTDADKEVVMFFIGFIAGVIATLLVVGLGEYCILKAIYNSEDEWDD